MDKTLIAAFIFFPWMVSGTISPPSWPKGYSYECTIKNKDDFEQDVQYHVSLGKQKVREAVNGGTNVNFIEGYDGWRIGRASYFPTTNTSRGEYDVTQCFYKDVTNQGSDALPLLPNMSEFYKYVGNESYRGVHTQRWEQHFMGFHQTIWITYGQSENGTYPIPVSSDTRSYGGNDDSLLIKHTYIEYYNYDPREPDSSVWSDHDNVTCGILPGEESNGHSSSFQDLLQSQIEKRRESLLKRKSLAHAHNQGNSGYKLKLNKFAHMPDDEFAMYTSGYRGETSRLIEPFPYSDQEITFLSMNLPESVDWRIYGAVTHVRNQGKCGSCWAFGTVGVLEGAYFLYSQSLEVLSEQALVDCSWGAGNIGCDGGLPNNALSWVQEVGGIPSTAEYGQYSAINGHCRYNKTKLVAPIKRFRKVKPTVEALKLALNIHGPIAITIDAGDPDRREFSMYDYGVFKPQSWSNWSNHVVLLVGYGKLHDEPYWLVKNSWGLEWGLNGYVLISALNNTLNVLDNAWYAEFN